MSALARIALTPCGRSMLTRMNAPLAARAMQTSAGSDYIYFRQLLVQSET